MVDRKKKEMIEVGKTYRMKSNKQLKAKVENIDLKNKTVTYSLSGSLLSKVKSIADFTIKFERCP